MRGASSCLLPSSWSNGHLEGFSMHPELKGWRALQHSVNLIDLDFNGHTTNRRYVQLALACFEPSFLEAYRPDSLNIRFIHESRMGDELVCQTHPADAPQTFVGRIINGCDQEICKVSSQWVKREPLPDIASVNLIRHPQK